MNITQHGFSNKMKINNNKLMLLIFFFIIVVEFTLNVTQKKY